MRRALRWIAAQRHDVAHAVLPVGTGNPENLLARRADTRQMRRCRERRGFLNARHDVVSRERVEPSAP